MRKFLLLLAFTAVLCPHIKGAASSEPPNYTELKERVCKQIFSAESLSELMSISWDFLREAPGIDLVRILDAEIPDPKNQLAPTLESEIPKIQRCGKIFIEDPKEIAVALVELKQDWLERPLKARWERARFSDEQRIFIKAAAKAFLLKIHELSFKID